MRAKPGNFVMGEAVPFAQAFTYHDEVGIDQMLAPDFFLPVKSNIRVGDKIELIQIVGDQVRAEQSVRVVAMGEVEITLRTRPGGELVDYDQQKEPEKKSDPPTAEQHGRLMVQRGFGSFVVINEAGKQLAEFAKKAEAEAYLEELMAGEQKAA